MRSNPAVALLALLAGLACPIVASGQDPAQQVPDPAVSATMMFPFLVYPHNGAGTLLKADQDLITATGEEKARLQQAILVKTGLYFSSAVRAWALISDPEFVWRPQCAMYDALKDHIKTGVFTYPRKIRFPKGLLPLYQAHMFNIYFFDPLGKPYDIVLNRNYVSGDLGQTEVKFVPGGVTYLRVGNDENGDPRGFVMILFGLTEDTSLHPMTLPASRVTAKALLGAIPKGVIYVDAVAPEAVPGLEAGPRLLPGEVYRALGWPTNPLWSQDLLLSVGRLAVRLRPRVDPEPTCRIESILDVDLQNAGPEAGPYVTQLGREFGVEVDVRIPDFKGEVLVDWGDGQYSKVRPGTEQVHLHGYPARYLLQFLVIQGRQVVDSLAFPVLHSTPLDCRFLPAPVNPVREEYPLPKGLPAAAKATLAQQRNECRKWDEFYRDYWLELMLTSALPDIPGRDRWSEMGLSAAVGPEAPGR